MAGIVYLKTNKFDVKLEGITFKAEEFESICTTDFLFPGGKTVRISKPVVGIDVMRHPRDPFIVLVLLCFGVGCIILRFHSGDPLPQSIVKFLKDERIRFVGFGISEKRDLFPFEELGLVKTRADIGYLAAKVLEDPKYKTFDLAELARKVLGVYEMEGLTAASSFERHEQVKCAICQLFLSTVVAMTLLRAEHKKKIAASPKKFVDVSPRKKILASPRNGRKNKWADAAKDISHLTSTNSMYLLNDGLLKLAKGIDKNEKLKFFGKNEKNYQQTRVKEAAFADDSYETYEYKEGSSRGKNDRKSSKGLDRTKTVKEPVSDSSYEGSSRGKSEDKNPKVLERSNNVKESSPDFFYDCFEAFAKGMNESKNVISMERTTSVKEPDFSDDCYDTTKGSTRGKTENQNLNFFARCTSVKKPMFFDDFDGEPVTGVSSGDESSISTKWKEENVNLTKKPLKGILKCPSTGLENFNFSPPKPSSPPSTPVDQSADNAAYLKRANSKGCNVKFRFKD